MSEPNRLRGEAAPNSLWTAGSVPGGTRSTRSTRTSLSRRVFIAGIAMAIAGVPFFFVPDLAAEYAAIGLICLGCGLALTVVVRRVILDAVASARRSRVAAVGQLIFAPHLIAFGLGGLGLIGVGVYFLVAALGQL